MGRGWIPIMEGSASENGDNYPERSLWSAVMIQAYEDLRSLRTIPVMMKRLHRIKDSFDPKKEAILTHSIRRRMFDIESAQRWFLSDKEWTGSFIFCCEVLGICPCAVRESFKPMTEFKIDWV